MSISKRPLTTHADLTPVAGNGLLDRRALLGRGIMLAGAAATGLGATGNSAAAEPLKDDPWSETMGGPTRHGRSRRGSRSTWCASSEIPTMSRATRTPARRTI